MDCKKAECPQDDCNPQCVKPACTLPGQVPDWVAHIHRTRAAAESFHNCGILCFTLLLLIMCLASYIYCQECLFVILLVSACLCPFFHPLNAPLWLAIVLLTIGGWSFTAGAMEIRWKSHG